MTTPSGDRDLWRRFERQRESALSGVRPFDEVVARGRQRREHPVSLRRVTAAGAATVMTLVIIVMAAVRALGNGVQPATADVSPHSLDLGAVTWRGPTDFLLDTPGREFLLTVPTISATSTGSPESSTPGDTLPRSPDSVGRGRSGP